MARFVVVRVNGDPADSHAAEMAGMGLGAVHSRNNALNRALTMAGADPGSIVQWSIVTAPEAGAARLAPWPNGALGFFVAPADSPELAPETPVSFPIVDYGTALVVTPIRQGEFYENGRLHGPSYQFQVRAEPATALSDDAFDVQERRGFFVSFVVPDDGPRSSTLPRSHAFQTVFAKTDAEAIVQWAHEYEQHRLGKGKRPPLGQRSIDALARAFPDSYMERIARNGPRLDADLARALAAEGR